MLAAAVVTSAARSAINSVERDDKPVCAVLGMYKTAVEHLEFSGTERLFSEDSQIYESGGFEGTYVHYVAHHLSPEFADFKTFLFEDYRCSARFEGKVAIATETYRYRIGLRTGSSVERQGVQTSVLRQVPGSWQIVSLHNSSRKLP